MGFSDVNAAQDLCENPHPSNADSHQFAVSNEVAEKYKCNQNLSPSKSRNKSVILFDSWDSISGRKFEPTFQSPLENRDTIMCGQNQILKSGMLHAQDCAVQLSKEGVLHSYLPPKPVMASRDVDKLLHINISRWHPSQKLSALSRHTEEVPCSDTSRRQPSQDFPADTGKSHICNLSCSQESAVHIADKGELLCSDVSRKHIFVESSVDTDESHSNDPRSSPTQKSAVHSAEKEELLCSDVSRGRILQKYSVRTNQSHSTDQRVCPNLEFAVHHADTEELYSGVRLQEFLADTDEFHISNQQHRLTQESAVNIREEEEILCNDVSKSHFLQESSAEIGELHISNERNCPTREFAVPCTYKELLCSSVSKIHHVQESSVDTEESHLADGRSHPSQLSSAVHSTNREGLLCSDASKRHLLQESSLLNTGIGECG